MPNEGGKEAQESQTAGESTQPGSTVTDDELSRAFDEAVSETSSDAAEQQTATEEVKEQAKEEEKAEGETDDKEEAAPAEEDTTPKKKGDPNHPTNLGRKVVKLEDMVSQLVEQNTELLKRLTQPHQPATEREDEFVDLSTTEGLDRYLSKRESERENRATEDQVKYQSGYLASIKEWQGKAEDEGVADEIYKMLTDTKSPFNVRYSTDPKSDFEINASKATAHYWKTKFTSSTQRRENPLDKNKGAAPKAPLGVAGESRGDAGKTATTVKLDAASEELVKRWGWTQEQVAAALAGDTPMHLRRGR
jgi:hypothetical protein